MSIPVNLYRSHVTVFRTALLAALVLILYLSTTSVRYPVIDNINDKLSHALAFYVLGWLADFSFPRSDFRLPKALPLLAYGLLIEAIQHFLPYRSASAFDLVADGFGLLLYALSVPLLKRVPLLDRRWEPRPG